MVLIKKACTCLKGGGVQPLKVLEILNSNGVLTTDENEMDKIAREAWGNVFEGNVQNEEQMLKHFKEKIKNTSSNAKKSKLILLTGKM